MHHTKTAKQTRNDGSRRRVRVIKVSLAAAALLIGLPSTSFAEFHFKPFVSAQGEYESNVFYLPDNVYAVSPDNDRARKDVVRRYMAGLDTDFIYSQQRFFFTGEGRRYRYDRFTQLDHDEHLLYGGYDGKLGSAVDLGVHYRDEKRMATFAERLTTALTLEHERIGDAILNTAFTPTWTVEFAGRVRKFDSPLPAFPDFGIDENSGSITPRYISGGPMKIGLKGEYLAGKFRGLPVEAKYHQESLLATADYDLTDVTKMHGELGYTVRQDDNNSNSKVSALTGALEYDRELTGKTSINLQLFRRIATYVAGANAVVQTGGSASANWRPTEKIAMDIRYEQTRDNFEDAATPSAAAIAREDRLQTTSIGLIYQARYWISFRPYALYQTRSSNTFAKDYDLFFAGLELRLQLGKPN